MRLDPGQPWQIEADRIIEEVYQLRKDAAPAKPADAK